MSKSACIADFEQAAELRAGRKLLDARQHLLACGSVRCPADVQKECVNELALVERSLSSIVLGLRDEAGHDIVDARTFVDGGARPLDGQALLLDPGRHSVRFERTGCEPAEQLVLLAEGEKNRPIVGTLRCGADSATGDGAPAPTASATGTTSPAPAASVVTASPNRTLPLVLAGVGVVGLAGFAYFGIQGRADIDDVRSTGCAPSCDRDAVMQARTKLLVADVLGGVGLVSLGAAAWLFLSESSPAPSKRASFVVDVRPGPSGGAMLVRGLF